MQSEYGEKYGMWPLRKRITRQLNSILQCLYSIQFHWQLYNTNRQIYFNITDIMVRDSTLKGNRCKAKLCLESKHAWFHFKRSRPCRDFMNFLKGILLHKRELRAMDTLPCIASLKECFFSWFPFWSRPGYVLGRLIENHCNVSLFI